MAILFDGARFDTVSELAEYKKLMQVESTSAEEPPQYSDDEIIGLQTIHDLERQEKEELAKPESEPEPKVMLKHRRHHKAYSRAELGVLKAALEQHNYGRLPKNVRAALGMQLGRTDASVGVMCSHLRTKAGKRAVKGTTTVVVVKPKPAVKRGKNKAKSKTDGRVLRGRFMTSRANYLCKSEGLSYEQAFARASQEWSAGGSAGKVTAAKQRHTMPNVYPLTGAGSERLGDMLLNLTENKDHSINYNQSRRSLELVSSYSVWSITTWEIFIGTFLLKKSQIANVLGIDNKKLRVEMTGNLLQQIRYQ